MLEVMSGEATVDQIARRLGVHAEPVEIVRLRIREVLGRDTATAWGVWKSGRRCGARGSRSPTGASARSCAPTAWCSRVTASSVILPAATSSCLSPTGASQPT